MRQEAQQRYWQMREDYKEENGSVPAYVEPILIGRARAITAAGPGERSRIGRSMLAARGGHALQRKLRDQGLTGKNHPYAHMAAQVSAIRRRHRKEARERESLGLPPCHGSHWLPFD